MSRPAVSGARRVVVKVGSSSLTTASGGLDPERVRDAGRPAWPACAPRGAELVLVSSGAIAAGLAPLAFRRRPRDLARQQAAASVGQGMLVHRYTEEFARHGQVTGQVLLTVDDVTRRSHYRNAQRTFDKLLELGAVPIVNENDTVATSEIRFGDNDRLAALVAHLVHADLLVLLSDVDGLYDAPPGRPGSTLLADVPSVGTTSPASRSAAPAAPVSAPAAWRPSWTPPGSPPGPASRSSSPTPRTPARRSPGAPTGTLFHATGRRRPTRLLWLAHATEPRGPPGARRRRRPGRDRAAGLAAAGGRDRRGRQLRGRRPGRARGRPTGARWPAGWSTTTPPSCPALLGRSTRDLARELGAAYEREVVHRDDLVRALRPTGPIWRFCPAGPRIRTEWTRRCGARRWPRRRADDRAGTSRGGLAWRLLCVTGT